MKSILIIFLLAWMALGCYLCKNAFCGTTDKPSATKAATTAGAAATTAISTKCDKSLVFSDGDFNIKSTENFTFKLNDDKILRPSESFSETLTTVAKYIKENPDRAILLFGNYVDSENNREKLGVERATVVKKLLVSKYKVLSKQIRVGSEKITSCYTDTQINKGLRVAFGDK